MKNNERQLKGKNPSPALTGPVTFDWLNQRIEDQATLFLLGRPVVQMTLLNCDGLSLYLSLFLNLYLSFFLSLSIYHVLKSNFD
jgi:hypothetical protein